MAEEPWIALGRATTSALRVDDCWTFTIQARDAKLTVRRALTLIAGAEVRCWSLPG